VRKAAGEAMHPQPLAANVDVGLVMTSANKDLSPARHDRYLSLLRDGGIAPGPFAAIVLNFALLSDEIVPLLSALGNRLTPSGALVIQTVHPWIACGDAPYRDGWRTETFDALGGSFPSAMPWYFRTLSSWTQAIHEAGFDIAHLEEPIHPETERPLSLLMTCVRAAATPDAIGR